MCQIIGWISISLICCCFSSYNSILGSATMPRKNDAMAIGYDESNDSILLVGGMGEGSHPYFMQQFTIFKDDNFIDMGELYLSATEQTRGYSQHYTTLDDRLWILKENGNEFFWINTKTYTATTASFTLSTYVYCYACLVSLQTYLIVIGGEDAKDKAIDTVQIYDLSNTEWLNNVPILLTPRKTLSCLSVNNVIYAIGGDSDALSYLSSIEVLDASNMAQIQSQQWQYFSGTLHEAARATRAVQRGNNIIVIGGQGSSGRLTDVNLIDTSAGTCDKVGDLALATSYASSIIVRDILYLFGGWGSGALDSYQMIYLPALSPTPTTESSSVPPTMHPSLLSTVPPTIKPTEVSTMTESTAYVDPSVSSLSDTTLYRTESVFYQHNITMVTSLFAFSSFSTQQETTTITNKPIVSTGISTFELVCILIIIMVSLMVIIILICFGKHKIKNRKQSISEPEKKPDLIFSKPEKELASMIVSNSSIVHKTTRHWSCSNMEEGNGEQEECDDIDQVQIETNDWNSKSYPMCVECGVRSNKKRDVMEGQVYICTVCHKYKDSAMDNEVDGMFEEQKTQGPPRNGPIYADTNQGPPPNRMYMQSTCGQCGKTMQRTQGKIDINDGCWYCVECWNTWTIS